MPHSAEKLLRATPGVEVVDLLLPDVNGIVRGKRIPASSADKVFADGILLPASLFAADICGDTVEETLLGVASGDRDWACRALPDTLRSVPWTAGKGAQCLLEMVDADGVAFHSDPRHRLQSIVSAMHDNDLRPTVAVELEFYLLRNRLDRRGMPLLPINPVSGETERNTQVYSMEDLDDFRPFIERVRQYCERQSVPASAAVAEYAPGQFEINLEHKPDPLAACDDAVYLKRIIRTAAKELGFTATFMAKPMAQLSGSGMHIHVSIADAEGDNRFASRPNELEHAVAGLQKSMHDAMLLFAPHANSYRRFRKHCYVPLSPSWGHNNRTVAIRIPAGGAGSRRIEHRVAGADANPYLVVAAVLAGILDGYRRPSRPDAPITGNADEQCEPSLISDWQRAIETFDASDWIAAHFGREFRELFGAIKRHECAKFHGYVTPMEVRWYLRTV